MKNDPTVKKKFIRMAEDTECKTYRITFRCQVGDYIDAIDALCGYAHVLEEEVEVSE
jgi:hypothetical protein